MAGRKIGRRHEYKGPLAKIRIDPIVQAQEERQQGSQEGPQERTFWGLWDQSIWFRFVVTMFCLVAALLVVVMCVGCSEVRKATQVATAAGETFNNVASPAISVPDTTYIVKPGDSLYKICGQHNSPMLWPVLWKENKILDPDIITVGDELMIPGSVSVEDRVWALAVSAGCPTYRPHAPVLVRP